MPIPFQFKISNSWSLEHASKITSKGGSIKTHQVFLEKGKTLEVSAAKPFKGDPSKYNPEELLMAALSSCHFMSYLYVCEQAGITILEYSDTVEGILNLQANGSGAFAKISLNPQVKIENQDQIQLAESLHEKAGNLCFIANSCAFKIEYNFFVEA
ncbi:osmotically inducible protein OsmC [Formosa sediminum]|uniref:Osmotically inducible protein OsmC n=1 Tax=Formosa sediminum TaxID=2594004 RepID=A0A516GLV7_9FLAO|nr:OsmC family protein [Formosa sediminum]QDO92455.1 osmotically inducible protein OsmC [Formosa sediminum]